jgi:hypothetical protein
MLKTKVARGANMHSIRNAVANLLLLVAASKRRICTLEVFQVEAINDTATENTRVGNGSVGLQRSELPPTGGVSTIVEITAPNAVMNALAAMLEGKLGV